MNTVLIIVEDWSIINIIYFNRKHYAIIWKFLFVWIKHLWVYQYQDKFQVPPPPHPQTIKNNSKWVRLMLE